MRTHFFSLVLALSALGGAAAHAEYLSFSFGNSAEPVMGSGVLTVSAIGAGQYTVDSITGTTSYDGGPSFNITGLLPAGSFEGNDNELSLTSAGYSFDINGLSYQLSDMTDVNLFTDPSTGLSTESFQTANNTIGEDQDSYSVTPTPEPGSFVLLGTGLLGVAGVVRRRLQA